jgi:hypothetical protein
VLNIVIVKVIDFFKGLFYIAFALFLIWAAVCSFDVRPPMQDLEISISDANPGKEVDVVYNFIRIRQCAIKGTTNITDKKGQIVFTKNIDRGVNGNIGDVEQIDHYMIDSDANLGEARFDMFLEWECPYNIVHKMVNPITLSYHKTFVIKEP